eukprot:gene38431-47450_t
MRSRGTGARRRSPRDRTGGLRRSAPNPPCTERTDEKKSSETEDFFISAGGYFKRNALVLLQRFEASRLDSREVSEQIFAAFVRVKLGLRPQISPSTNSRGMCVTIDKIRGSRLRNIKSAQINFGFSPRKPLLSGRVLPRTGRFPSNGRSSCSIRRASAPYAAKPKVAAEPATPCSKACNFSSDSASESALRQ